MGLRAFDWCQNQWLSCYLCGSRVSSKTKKNDKRRHLDTRASSMNWDMKC